MGLIGNALITISGWIIGMVSVMFLFIFIALTKGTAWPTFKARITGSPLVLLQRIDEKYGMLTGKYRGGYIDLGTWGKFKCSEGTFKPFAGTTLAQAYEAVPTIPTAEFITACKKMRDKGHDDLGVIDLEAMQTALDNKKLKPEMSLERLEELLNTPGIKPESKAKLEKVVKKRRYIESIFSSIAVIEDFQTTGGSPIALDDIIDQEANMKSKLKNKDNLARIITIGIAGALILAGIAAIIYIYASYAQCPTAQDFIKLANTCKSIGGTASVPM